LLTRGYSVMHGYWDDEDKTRQAIDPQGWMHTGDLATLDESGYCNIVGRVKDLIIRGGENISPREIEEFLYRTRRSRTCRSSACRIAATARWCARGSS
jgi:fatty-acyl-CoA synthase